MDASRLVAEWHGPMRPISTGDQQQHAPDDQHQGQQWQVGLERVEGGRHALGEEVGQHRGTQPMCEQERAGDQGQIEQEDACREGSGLLLQHGICARIGGRELLLADVGGDCTTVSRPIEWYRSINRVGGSIKGRA